VHADVNISLTQNTSKHSFPCCAVKSFPLVNDWIYWSEFPTFTHPFAIWRPRWGNPLELSGHIWYGKTRTAGLQSGKGRMMIDSSCLGAIHQRDRHTDRHVAISNAAPTYWRRAAKKLVAVRLFCNVMLVYYWQRWQLYWVSRHVALESCVSFLTMQCLMLDVRNSWQDYTVKRKNTQCVKGSNTIFSLCLWSHISVTWGNR